MTLLPPDFLNAVVALGFQDADGATSWSATGFLLGRPQGKGNDGRTQFRLFIVTNRHVFKDASSARVRLNPGPAGPAGEYGLQLLREDGTSIWKAHSDPEIDLCVLPIAAGKLQRDGLQLGFINTDGHVATLPTLSQKGLSEGDSVYVLGYPMGLVGTERNYAITRSGCIARIRDAQAGNSKEFLVDTFIFPGNSGGPVVLKPEIVSVVGTEAIREAYVIGVVKGYVPYQEVAISQQTKRPRVVFEENSGLASAHPIEYVLEILEEGYPLPKEDTATPPSPGT